MNRLLWIVTVLLLSMVSYGQEIKKNISVKETAVVTYKSSWGPVQSGNAPIAQISAIAPAAILVKDNSGNLYPVISFRINYIFKSTYRDDETQELKVLKDLRVSDFYDTAQLPATWVESIRDNIKTGDEILYNKIMFRNKSGKMQLAPDVKIVAQ
ncbi:MAG: hypothetical protein ACK5AO_00480 [bacterium]|jgi:hypothetical protein